MDASVQVNLPTILVKPVKMETITRNRAQAASKMKKLQIVIGDD